MQRSDIGGLLAGLGLSIAPFLSGCPDKVCIGSGCDEETGAAPGGADTGVGEPTTDCAPPTAAWDGDADYRFAAGSFRCDDDPVDRTFTTDSGDFVSHGDEIDSEDQVYSAVDLARDEWHGTLAGFRLRYHGAGSDVTSDAVDHRRKEVSLVFMVNDSSDDGPWAAHARAFSHYYDSAHYSECDVKFFAKIYSPAELGDVPIPWNPVDGSISGKVSLPGVLAHEFGHCLGMDDNSIVDSVMYWEREAGEDIVVSDEDALAAYLIYGPA